jgi:hypothetical protein
MRDKLTNPNSVLLTYCFLGFVFFSLRQKWKPSVIENLSPIELASNKVEVSPLKSPVNFVLYRWGT